MAKIVGVEFCSTSISVDGIRNLIVAALVETTEIKPDFGDVGIDTDSTRVGVERISKLIDLKIENTNRTPKVGLRPSRYTACSVSLHTPCYTFGRPYRHGPKGTSFVHPKDLEEGK